MAQLPSSKQIQRLNCSDARQDAIPPGVLI
jgi:hypothetical protein